MIIHILKFENVWKYIIKSSLEHQIKCLFFVLREICNMNRKSKKGIIKSNTLWLERINRIFKEKSSSTINLWEDICALSGFWASRSSLFTNYSVSFIAFNLYAFYFLLCLDLPLVCLLGFVLTSHVSPSYINEAK